MYPYFLNINPYPSSPTPALVDSRILGGNTHKQARTAILSCIEDLYGKLGSNPTDKDFRLITMIQDVGSGKTHLALHIRGLPELSTNTVTSYVDLSRVSPRDIYNTYESILSGFSNEDVITMREAIISMLSFKAEKNVGPARKIFKYGLSDRIAGKSFSDKARLVLQGKETMNYDYVDEVLRDEFSEIQIDLIKGIVGDKFRRDSANVRTLEGVINSLSAIANLNFRLLNKLTIFQFDEFDSNKETLEIIKALINAHIPSSLLMLIMTPASYNEIKKENASVFDRMEKANYKIDLAGSNTVTELLDIIFEYIRHYDKINNFTPEHENELASRIRVIYDEFPEFRNVRSILNILYHATENAARTNSFTIDEQSIDDTIKRNYPGLKIRGSLMDVPLSEFIRIRKNSMSSDALESNVRDAIKNLLAYTTQTGSVTGVNIDNIIGNSIDVVYNDNYGTKVAVAVVVNKDHSKALAQISSAAKSLSLVDRLVVLTNTGTTVGENGTTVVNMDKGKLIDLIYFNDKFKNEELLKDDLEKAVVLAKSMKLC
ncbi:MAG TPA: hypothetical protein VK462_01840 [Nitrososphaeraceae archaeon]|nr:hypothetical protein [Nitrososphaeraceae archaeon]